MNNTNSTKSYTIGIADTMFARGDMGSLAEKTINDNINSSQGTIEIVRYTVPGVKDLPVACKKLFSENNCDIVIACGFVGAEHVDKICGHEASSAIQLVQLEQKKHIIEVFVHEDEGTDKKLATIMHNRVVKHTLNTIKLLEGRESLQSKAGSGERQGWNNAKQLDISNVISEEAKDNQKFKIGIVVSEFNREITFGMRDQAIEYIKSHRHTSEVLEVPGVFDMPLAIKKFCQDRSVDAIVLLSAVITGETKHDKLIANTTARIAANLSVKFNKPISCGIIGPGATWKQAESRHSEYVKRSVDASLRMLEIL
jgi:riboflavin synthase